MLRRNASSASIALAVSVLISTGASAVAQRTFVASSGNDANPCSIAQPCRSFAAALAQTIDTGEIVVLDSAGYGPVTIAQSVSITAPAGVYAGISVPVSQTGITISAGTFDVILRGVSIVGQGGGGIVAHHSGTLMVERCTIDDVTGTAITVAPSSSSIVVAIRDTSITRISGDGIDLSRASGTIEHVSLTRLSGRAIDVGQSSTMAVSDTTVSYALNGGIAAGASGGQTTRLSVTNSTLSNIVGYGIVAADFGGVAIVHATGNTLSFVSSGGLLAQSPSAKLIATRNSVADSPWGLVQNVGGTLISFGDNPVYGNTAQTTGTISHVTWQ